MLLNKPLLARMASGVACAVASTGLVACLSSTAFAQDSSKKIGAVFYIELENHNWTQDGDTTAPNQIFGCVAAPYINSLVTPDNKNAKDVSYAIAYHHVLSTPSGDNPSIHPSEPNYLWQEAGTNFGILNDNDPYVTPGGSVAAIAEFLAANPTYTGEHMTGLMEKNGLSWYSYQEDIDLLNTDGGNFNNNGGTITSTPAPEKDWTVPLSSFSGTSTSYTNPFNGSNQYNFACKHDGTLFFKDTNGGNVTDTTNKKRKNYRPLQQLFSDLENNKVARYNLITPDQYNDMHSALTNGFVYQGIAYTGDLSQIAASDNFLSIVIPKIMASQAYQDNGVIIIWTDETEGTNQNNFAHTLAFIVISKLAKGGAYASVKDFTHSSDLATLQKVFGLRANTSSGYLNDAANPQLDGTTDISDMFKPGVIPKNLPKF